MPTENEELIPIVRDINILLSLDTYQGMSDEEIKSVISFKINEAVEKAYSDKRFTQLEDYGTTRLQEQQRLLETSESMIQSVLNQSIPWATISADGTVIQNV